MQGFPEFLDSLVEELRTWTANDGGLTMAASDELARVSFFGEHAGETKEKLFSYLAEDFTDWCWVDQEVAEFLAD